MPRRYGVNTRLWVYRFLVLRDGEQCARCFEIPTTQNKLEIDHVDGCPWNNDPPNLRLLCKRCNVTLENKARVVTSPPSAQKERERTEGQSATRVVKEAVNYKHGAPEMQANFLFEVDFRNWLLEKVKDLGHYPRGDAIAGGAEVVGCSVSTTTKYLAKLVSSEGPLKESKDLMGDLYLELKAHLEPEPAIRLNLDTRTNVLKEAADEPKLDRVSSPGHQGARLPLPLS